MPVNITQDMDSFINHQVISTRTRMLRIKRAKDPMMWYANLIGQLVPYLGEWPGDAYISREPAGHRNRVEFADTEIILV